MQQEQEIRDLYHLCFDDDEAFEDAFFRLVYSPEEVILEREQGEIVSVVFCSPCHIRLKTTTLSTAPETEVLPIALSTEEIPTTLTVENVPTSLPTEETTTAAAFYLNGFCTHPDHRGKDHADRTMREALRRGYERGDCFALLIPASSSLFDYYARYDFAVCFDKDESVASLASKWRGCIASFPKWDALYAEYEDPAPSPLSATALQQHAFGMARILNLPRLATLMARLFPDLCLSFAVHDELLPHNTGIYTFLGDGHVSICPFPVATSSAALLSTDSASTDSPFIDSASTDSLSVATSLAAHLSIDCPLVPITQLTPAFIGYEVARLPLPLSTFPTGTPYLHSMLEE